SHVSHSTNIELFRMKNYYITVVLAVFVFAFRMCHRSGAFEEEGYDDRLSGGAATVFDATSKAFTHEVEGLNGRDLHIHKLGDVAFEQTFVAAGAARFGGLGPAFNNVSCISCHHNDGKGTP